MTFRAGQTYHFRFHAEIASLAAAPEATHDAGLQNVQNALNSSGFCQGTTVSEFAQYQQHDVRNDIASGVLTTTFSVDTEVNVVEAHILYGLNYAVQARDPAAQFRPHLRTTHSAGVAYARIVSSQSGVVAAVAGNSVLDRIQNAMREVIEPETIGDGPAPPDLHANTSASVAGRITSPIATNTATGQTAAAELVHQTANDHGLPDPTGDTPPVLWIVIGGIALIVAIGVIGYALRPVAQIAGAVA